ncbi:MAG TPA: hypothetical protein VKU42_03365 [Candidatus Angelobacter sp.]|nr:hypothetical protein [Candidatus Angelobacter sp.]
MTPSAGFPNPVPTAGISDAGRAGISNATSGIETTTAPSSPATIVSTPSVSLSESTNLSESANQTAVSDLGSSTFVGGAAEESAPGTISLAEVSSRYKAEKGTRNARMLSNEDVQTMLNNKSGVTMAKNMPPLGPGALEQSGQGTETQNATQSAQSTQQTNASTNQQGQVASGQTGTPPPAPAGQSANSSTSAENSTTPQINQNQQSNDAQGSRRLPATATFLPLLGLLGLVSGGIGLWFRKFKN